MLFRHYIDLVGENEIFENRYLLGNLIPLPLKDLKIQKIDKFIYKMNEWVLGNRCLGIREKELVYIMILLLNF